MAANPTIYCLEEITDYSQFETLCTDLMTLEGYKSIEPLGGFKDKGRDAIHTSKANKTTIFAYSVREDWRAKLSEDASSIQKHGHTCNTLVFITTSRFTAGERDEAVSFIQKRYGWKLKLIGVTKLRNLLDVSYPNLKKNYPQVFPPQFLTADFTIGKDQQHLFVHYSREDQILGDWIARKLTAEGYAVWSENLKLLGGEKFPTDIDNAIKNKTLNFIALYSNTSINNVELTRQRNIALNKTQDEFTKDFLIPVNVDNINQNALDRLSANLKFIEFNNNWARGYKQLLKKLDSLGTPKPLQNGKNIAAASFFGDDVLTQQTEKLISNCLHIDKIPDIIFSFSSEQKVSEDVLDKIQHLWPHKFIPPNLFLSFQKPPKVIIDENKIELESSVSWRLKDKIFGIRTNNIVSELIKKSLFVKLREKGLKSNTDTEAFYFPKGLVEKDHIKYVIPDGKSNYVNVYGERKYWKRSGSEKYRYYLSPVFTVKQNLIDEFIILIRIQVRLTDSNNNILPDRTARSRRKHLCKDWWNNDWLTRMLAICHYIAENQKIIIGTIKDEQIIINATPLIIKSPFGIDESALNQDSFERDEFSSGDDAELIEEGEEKNG